MGTRRKSYEEVYKEFSDRGYLLLTKEYKNNKQKLKYICPKHSGSIQTIRRNDLISGHGCSRCGRKRSIENMRNQAKKQKRTIEDVREEIESVEGFSLVSDIYINAKERLEIKCPKGHITEQRIGDFRQSKTKCRECAVEKRRAPYSTVKKAFEERSYELLTRTYKNSTQPLKYICSAHPEEVQTITYDSINGGHGCYYCGIERISGKNSVHYNHSLTDEDRERNRKLDPKEREWRIKVYKRDNFTCQKCGKYYRNNVNAHHKDAYHWCVERRYDVTNGATLCEWCHKNFHTEYGYKNNTEEQYQEWLEAE